MKIKRIISAFLTLVMTAGSLAVGTEAAWADKVNKDGEPLINYLTTEYKRPEDKLKDMVLVKEQYGYQLYFEEFTGEVALLDTTTGQILFSNPYDIASPYVKSSLAIKQKLLSQILLTYLDNGNKRDMNSYVEAALRGQIIMKNIKGGIRVEYALGEEKVTRLVPRIIEKSRYEELIYKNLSEFNQRKMNGYYTLKDPKNPNETEKTIAAMKEQFPITEKMAVYVCSPTITTSELRNVEKIIKAGCPEYTHEQLEYDHELTNYTGDDIAPPRFRMAIEYKITETGLEARLPANGIAFDESVYQFQTVTLLPYMGAGSNEFTGYTFIPDGSGALIRFEDIKGTAYNVAGQMYGPDYAYHTISGQHQEVMRYPVYGVVTNYDKVYTDDEGKIPELTQAQIDAGVQLEGLYSDNGFLAIITEGDSLATLMSEHGGTVHPYNTVYPIFTPRPSDTYKLSTEVSVTGNATWTVTSKRKYTESYTINYVMLKDEEICEKNGIEDYYASDYVGMAEAYRDYLTNTGVISRLENTKDNIPLYIETFGSLKTTERVASFPVTVDTPLTTFENVKTMYEELTEMGVGNVNFKLTGYANGGMEPTVPYKLKWIKAVGGNEGFTDMVAYAEEKGFDIFPDFDFAYVQHQENFDGFSMRSHAVKTIDDRYTSRRAYDPATQAFDRSFSIAISPSVYEYLYDTFGPNYSAFGNDSIAVSTLGTDLNSDFDADEPYHREDGKNFTSELMARIDKDVENVMVEGGNAYIMQYADIITGMSLSSSRFVNASESVPFIGMVLHGSKVFTGSPTNMEGDINEAILRSIESGASMYFILSYDNTSKLKEDKGLSKYYSVDYEIWKDDLVKYYTVLNDATKDLQDSFIVDHEFLADAERVPDPDELEADKLAEEAAKAAEEAAAAAKAEAEARKKRLEERLAAQRAEMIAAGLIEPDETTAPDETLGSEETAEPEANPDEEAVETEPVETAAPEGEPTEGDNLNEFGEEEIVEEVEEEVLPEKYATVSGSVVRVAYENGINFILNYNNYEVTVEYNGVVYNIPALNFVRID